MIPLRDDIPSRTRPLVGWLLIGANAAVFWHELSLGRSGVQEFVQTWGLVPARYSLAALGRGLSWAEYLGPFLTSMFLHGGWLHLISNMWTLYIFGDNVEDRLGKARFLLFYVVCGLVAAGAQAAANPRSTLPMVGASGAIAGVMGAYFVLFPHARVLTLVPIFVFLRVVELPAALYLGIWLLTQVMAARPGAQHMGGGGVAWWAHIGGFVAGIVLLGLFVRRGRRPRA